MLAVLAGMALPAVAQDGNIAQIRAEQRNRSRESGGDREYYGLWYKDLLMGKRDKKKVKPRFASPEDSLRLHKEFISHYTDAYNAFHAHKADSTILFADSALATGFESPDLYFFMANSYERLGDYKLAEAAFATAKEKGFPAGSLALKEFKKRQKARRKK